MAYIFCTERIGKPPAPMLDDYGKLIRELVVYVLEADGKVVGILVLKPKDHYMLLENITIYPL